MSLEVWTKDFGLVLFNFCIQKAGVDQIWARFKEQTSKELAQSEINRVS